MMIMISNAGTATKRTPNGKPNRLRKIRNKSGLASASDSMPSVTLP